MKLRDLQFKFPTNPFCDRLAILTCVALLSLGQDLSIAQQATLSPQTQSQQMATLTPTPTVIPEEAPKLSNDQLDSLVAPIALYPDLLLAQTLAASTYPLEVIQLQQWLERNKNLKDKKLVDAIAKKPWDPSVQSMAAYPEALQRMASNIEWTTELGNAFLAQQSDVMDAVQRMRAKAQNKGTLQTDLHQKVEKQTEGGKEVVTIEPADPEVVYVPYYDPEYIYGPPVYPYYPDHYPGYYPGMGLIWAAIILGPRVLTGAIAIGATGTSTSTSTISSTGTRLIRSEIAGRVTEVTDGSTIPLTAAIHRTQIDGLTRDLDKPIVDRAAVPPKGIVQAPVRAIGRRSFHLAERVQVAARLSLLVRHAVARAGHPRVRRAQVPATASATGVYL